MSSASNRPGTKKAFRSVVRLQVVHARTPFHVGNEGVKGVSIRRKTHPAVHVQTQIGPHLSQMGFSSDLQYTRAATKDIQLGTPAKMRTSSFAVASATASTFCAQSSIKAMSRLGVRRASHHGGRCLTMIALEVTFHGLLALLNQCARPTQNEVFPLIQLGLRHLMANCANTSFPPL